MTNLQVRIKSGVQTKLYITLDLKFKIFKLNVTKFELVLMSAFVGQLISVVEGRISWMEEDKVYF